MLLNKFNVLRYHVLVVTKEYEHQNDPLRKEDLEVMQEVVRCPTLYHYLQHDCDQ